MNPAFQRLMNEAARLTRSGNLKAATSVIKAALGRVADDPVGGDVIDVEAREVRESHGVRTPAPAEADAAHPDGRFIAGCFTTSAGSRDYKLFLPPDAADKSMPLVVMLHGCTQDPDDFAAGTRMNELAREHGFLVLYPAQSKRANPSTCWNWFKHNHQQRDRGEPSIIAGMTREVMARHDVDPARVHVAGLSAGGAMAAILGAAYPELFASVGVHSGLPVGAATSVNDAFAAMRSGAVGRASSVTSPPTIVFHGDQDATVHAVNGEQVIASAVAGSTPTVEPGRSASGRGFTRKVYADAGGHAVAEHWSLHGAGHAWSGGSADGSYTDPNGPDASAEMLRFFQAHPRR